MTTPSFKLQFKPERIHRLAARYTDEQTAEERQEEQRIVTELSTGVRKRGFYTRDEFVALCRWKSLRARRRYEELSKELIAEVTKIALGARAEELRIGTLTVLDGVSWPTASVLLHFGHRDPYPILDFRALESLGVTQPSSYTFDFWWQYVQACRKLAAKYKVDMRTLDRALWQYSAEEG